MDPAPGNEPAQAGPGLRVLVSLTSGGHGTVGGSPEETIRLLRGAALLWRQVERVGSAQPGEGKVVGRPPSAFQCLKGPPRELKRHTAARILGMG